MSRAQKIALDRAVEMLKVASEHIGRWAPEQTTQYDGTDCDGYCITQDCHSAVEDLTRQFAFERVSA